MASKPLPPEYPDLPTWLAHLVESHHGKLTTIATILGCSRAYVGRLMGIHGLEDRAAALRRQAGVTGPRKPMKRADQRIVRAAMVQAIAAAGSDEAARAALKMPRRSFYRRKALLKITQRVVSRATTRLRRGLEK